MFKKKQNLSANGVASGENAIANKEIEGLSQGQTAPSTATNRGEMLKPYVAKQKEVGVKLAVTFGGAGVIHGDFEKGFIRAETVARLREAGSEPLALSPAARIDPAATADNLVEYTKRAGG